MALPAHGLTGTDATTFLIHLAASIIGTVAGFALALARDLADRRAARRDACLRALERYADRPPSARQREIMVEIANALDEMPWHVLKATRARRGDRSRRP